MKVGTKKGLFKAVCPAVVVLAASLLAPIYAGEPAPAPSPDDRAKKLLEQEAVKQEQWRQEIKAEVDAHYQAAQKMVDNFDYENAKKSSKSRSASTAPTKKSALFSSRCATNSATAANASARPCRTSPNTARSKFRLH